MRLRPVVTSRPSMPWRDGDERWQRWSRSSHCVTRPVSVNARRAVMRG